MTAALLPLSAVADTYQFYFPTNAMINSNQPTADWAKAKIINTNSFTTFDGRIDGYYNLNFADLETPASLANGGQQFGAAVRYDPASSPITILDFAGTSLKIRQNAAIDLALVGGAPGSGYTYDIVAKIDLATGNVTETILIASTQEAADIALSAGKTVVLDRSDIQSNGQAIVFTSYSANITNESEANRTTDGGLMVKKVQAADGSSLVRQDEDGTLHIGENSVRISLMGLDRIDSTVGALYLGNLNGHRTIVEGTLEIQEPTQPNHAATKNYVDSNFPKKGYVDSGLASVVAVSSLPQATNGESMFGVGVGRYGNSNGIAIGLSSHVPKYNFNFKANLSHATGGKTGLGFGAGWRFK